MRTLFRRLARVSRFALASIYALGVSLAALLYALGATSSPSLQAAAWLIGVIAFSVLFPVVTWYRTEEVPGAAMLLTLATTLGFVLGFEVSLLFVSGGGSTAALFGLGVLFFLPIRIMILWLAFAALVAVGRRFRGVFAPDTIGGQEITPHSGGAA